MKIALVLGHDKKSKGAYSKVLKKYENDLARDIAYEYLKIADADIITRLPNSSYSSAMKEVLKVANNGDYDVVFELHFNSSDNPQANGCECLVYHKSSGSKEIAKKFNDNINKATGIKIRNSGLVEVKSSSDRGGYGIVNSKPKWILIEPFFGSSTEDSNKISAKIIAEAIYNSIR